MHPYPHLYRASADGAPTDLVEVTSPGLPAIPTTPPPEFDGPPGTWSPETLLCASIADCLILTFRAVARASKFEWSRLTCEVEGRLERVDGVARFTHFLSRVTLHVPAGTDAARARLLLEKAEHGCLVANSLTGQRELAVELVHV